MKKYVYILLLLASVSTLAENQTVKEKHSTRTEIPTKGNI